MSDFKSHRDYQDFASEVRLRSRFVQTRKVQQFLDALACTSAKRTIKLGAGTVLHRAQRGCDVIDEEEDKGWYVPREVPYSIERMVPDPEHVRSGGRGNPPGIAYLYLADARKTAVAEARPWLKAFVSVATFRIERDLKLIDLTLPATRDFYPHPLLQEHMEEMVWATLNASFAQPVHPDETQLEYVPTQYLAEFFREQGFDGVLYASTLVGGGRNYMVFNLMDASIAERDVVRVKDVSYVFDSLPVRG